MWISDKIRTAVAIGLAFALMGMVVYHLAVTSSLRLTIHALEGNVATLNKDKAELETSNALYERANADMSRVIDEQNSAIASLSVAGKLAEKRALEKVAAAETKATGFYIDAEYWRNRQVSETDDCLATFAILDAYIEKRRGEQDVSIKK